MVDSELVGVGLVCWSSEKRIGNGCCFVSDILFVNYILEVADLFSFSF